MIFVKILVYVYYVQIKSRTLTLDEQTQRTGEETGLINLFNGN